jgi:hypothetical protein
VALPTFDPAKHHVGLKAAGDLADPVGLMIDGQRRKSFRREIGDDQRGVHYGSDSFFNEPGLSSWTQDDFTGGGWQQVWGKDPAMFAGCSNLLPAQFDRSLRTVPPMTLRAAAGVGGGIYAGAPLAFFNHLGWVIAFYGSRLYRMNTFSGSAAEVIYPEPDAVPPYTHAMYDRRSQGVIATYVGGTGPGVARVDPMTGAYTDALEAGAASNVGSFTGLNGDGDRLVVGSANVVFTLQLQPDSANFFDSDWTRVGRLPAPWIDSCWMGQQLYILCGSADSQASVVAFDGVQILPVCDLPFNFYGKSITSYAGRLYVGGAGLDVGGGNAYAELYEVTGASVRLVKTFAPEQRSGRYVAPTTIDAMVVHEGLLFFGQTGYGLIAYDVTTDSLYGAQTFDGGGSTRAVVALTSARSRIWAWVPYPTIPFQNGIWGGAVSGDSVPDFGYSGIFISSDFSQEIDRMKSWKKVRVLTRGDSNDPVVQASVDGGQTWIACPLLDEDAAGSASFRSYDLSGVPTSRLIRFAISLPRFSSPTVGFAELVAFSASFQLVDSDNLHENGTQKLGWTFVVDGNVRRELDDGSVEEKRVDELRSLLWGWATSRQSLSFTDVDGQTYTVVIDSCDETQPFVLPPVVFDDPAGPAGDAPAREAFFALTLLEE